MTTPFRRSAGFMNSLVKIAGQQSQLLRKVQAEKHDAALEIRRAADIDRVYNYIERAARGGAVRVFDWDWSTPQKERDLIFRDDEIKTYLQYNGFSYDYNCVEWWHAKTDELK
jgi:hypothetical protein